MRFHIAIASTILLLSGCGGMKQASLAGGANNASSSPRFRRDIPRYPKVVFIGDEVTLNWFPQASVWINKGVAGQTSAQILARFQTDVIDLHPDIVHIVAGTTDVFNFPNDDSAASGPALANIASMASMAQAAGIKVIVGTIPPQSVYKSSESTPHVPIDVDISLLNLGINEAYGTEPTNGVPAPAHPGVTSVDYDHALCGCNDQEGDFIGYLSGLTTDGVSPNAAGYDVMSPLAEAAIAAFKIGAPK